MDNLFGFLGMFDDYEERALDHYEKGDIIVDTCLVTDSHKPYETGICHPKYNVGDWVIVELYDTKEEAQVGHDKWVKKMTAKKLPSKLKDVSTCCSASMIREMDEGSLEYDGD